MDAFAVFDVGVLMNVDEITELYAEIVTGHLGYFHKVSGEYLGMAYLC